jgi:dethiobiotin synthetase
MKGYFITGTDTAVGKTKVAGIILQQLGKENYTVAGLKPVATDCIRTSEGLINSDAKHLQNNSTIRFPYQWINPFVFEAPIAPYIAALQTGQYLSVRKIMAACEPVLTSDLDWLVVEGVGGWKQPLNRKETMADLAKALDFPIILVVRLRLGCINHALLTYESILQKKVLMKGWIANICEPVNEAQLSYLMENIRIIQEFLDIPFLGLLPYNASEPLGDFI